MLHGIINLSTSFYITIKGIFIYKSVILLYVLIYRVNITLHIALELEMWSTVKLDFHLYRERKTALYTIHFKYYTRNLVLNFD